MYKRVHAPGADSDDEDEQHFKSAAERASEAVTPAPQPQTATSAPSPVPPQHHIDLISFDDATTDAAGTSEPTSRLYHPRHAMSMPGSLQADGFDDLFGASFEQQQAPQQPSTPQAAAAAEVLSRRASGQQHHHHGPPRHAASTNDLSALGQPTEQPADTQQQEPLDFETTDGSVSDQRELLLYAVPLYQDPADPVKGLVFLPVANFQEEKDYTGISGRMQKRIDDMQGKVEEAWDELKQKDSGSIGNKVFKVGNRVVNDLTPEERLTKNIPKNVTKVIIYHPTQVPPDLIMERLTNMTGRHGTWTAMKAVAATLMLPIAFGVDVIIIPGPSVLTWYTSFQLYKHMRSAMGNQRLVQYLGDPKKAVRVNYAGDLRLDPYWDLARSSPDGVLGEELCEHLVADIGQKELLEPLLELRRRRLEEQASRSADDEAGDYAPLRSTDVHT